MSGSSGNKLNARMSLLSRKPIFLTTMREPQRRSKRATLIKPNALNHPGAAFLRWRQHLSHDAPSNSGYMPAINHTEPTSCHGSGWRQVHALETRVIEANPRPVESPDGAHRLR